jgi:hypothetical protein
VGIIDGAHLPWGAVISLERVQVHSGWDPIMSFCDWVGYGFRLELSRQDWIYGVIEKRRLCHAISQSDIVIVGGKPFRNDLLLILVGYDVTDLGALGL